MYNKGLKGFAYYSHKYVKLQFNRLRHRQDEGLYQWNNLYHMKNDYLCEKIFCKDSVLHCCYAEKITQYVMPKLSQ